MIRKAADGNWIDEDYEIERTFEVAQDAPQWLQDDYAAHFVLLRKRSLQAGEQKG
jgi:hypothetical protein